MGPTTVQNTFTRVDFLPANQDIQSLKHTFPPVPYLPAVRCRIEGYVTIL